MAETIYELVADRFGDGRVGLVFEDRTWTWGDVVDEALARAALLRQSGLDGKHIGVLLDNLPEYFFLLCAAALTGSVVVGANDTRRGEALAGDLRHTDCAVILTDRSKADLLAGVDPGAPVRLVDDTRWTDAVGEHRGAPAPAAGPPRDALFLLVFTSGSTGAPKAVRVSQERAVRMMAGAASVYTDADVLYCSMPMFHLNALMGSLFPGLSAGSRVVLKRRFSATSFLSDVREHGCTSFNYVGRALSYILAQPPTAEDADNALVFCVGAEASVQDRKAFRRRFGCYVVEGYTSSEGGVSINPFPGMPEDALGRPPDGMDVAIVDPESGAERARAVFGASRALLNPTDAIGEIVRRDAEASFEGYYANDDADAVRTRNGWFWSGDLGYRDEEGTFYFAGRGDDWLRVDGENFAAAPVETILARHPAVAASVVFAVPDPRTGDQVMAAVELRPGAGFDADAFAVFLAAQADLGTKWAPTYVRVVDAIPVTGTGKIDRKSLRAHRWQTTDPVWWRRGRELEYDPLTLEDVRKIGEEFEAAGRGHLLR
ncbi:MAG TPA: AMP-binding protein [Acidimicrobiales bacterium]|jgi:fatty-acyl-CoA synthase|nr:AMP-binding protein [Acidimicrobiales bacterium]